MIPDLIDLREMRERCRRRCDRGSERPERSNFEHSPPGRVRLLAIGRPYPPRGKKQVAHQ